MDSTGRKRRYQHNGNSASLIQAARQAVTPSKHFTSVPRPSATLILEGIAEGFVSLDSEWRYTFVSKKAGEILHVLPENLIGKVVWEEFPDSVGTLLHRTYLEAVQDRQLHTFSQYYAPWGMWFENRVYPTSNGLSVFFHDITERKLAEEEEQRTQAALQDSERWLRLALDSGRLGTWHVDMRTGEYVEMSDMCHEHIGASPGTIKTRTDFLKYVHADDRLHIEVAVTTALIDKLPYDTEFRTTNVDGSVRWIHARATPVCDDRGDVVRIIGVTLDVTEAKRLHEQQAKMLADALRRADHDPLTNLLNHRAFHKRLEDECARVQRTGESIVVAMMDIDNFKFFNDAYGHTTGDEVLRQVAARLRSVCRPGDVIGRFGGDEFSILCGYGGDTRTADIENHLLDGMDGLVFRPASHGMSIPITVSVGAVAYPKETTNWRRLILDATERLEWTKAGGETRAEAYRIRSAVQQAVTGFSMLDALVTAVHNKDRYTRRHSEDVMTYCLMIAKELGIDPTTQHTIAVAALLHDVGKVGVPDSILRKPAPLTTSEYEAVKQHPQMGAIIVSAIPGLEGTLDAIQHHHERWDGSGYPFGLREQETPLIARLMAVADAYSAMTTDRPYRLGMDRGVALKILEQGSGSQWDPKCVNAFVHAVHSQPSSY